MMPRNSGTSSSCMRVVNIRASVDLSASTFALMALFRESTRLCNVMVFVLSSVYLPAKMHFAGWL